MKRLARKKLPKAIFDFVEGGAADEWTIGEYERAFHRYPLLQRAFVDVLPVVVVQKRDSKTHKRLRGAAQKALTPRRIAELRRTIQELIDGYLDGHGNEADLMPFADEIPLIVIMEMLGSVARGRTAGQGMGRRRAPALCANADQPGGDA